MTETITCRNCGRPIQLDNTDGDELGVPAEIIAAALPPGFPRWEGPLGDFWRHADTGEPGSGLTLCPGSVRYTADATYAEP